MKRLLMAALLAAGVAAAPVALWAADKPAEKPAEGAKGAKPARPASRPFNGTIKSYDAATKTLTLEGPKAQSFLVGADTKIVKAGKAATTDDLKAGEAVAGFARPNDEGKLVAVTIRVGAPPARRAPAEKPKEGDKK